MANLIRAVVGWTGPGIVGLAANVLYFSEDPLPSMADVLDAYETLNGILPTGTVISVPTSGDIVNEADGSLIGAWTDTSGGNFTNTGTTAVSAAGVGACVGWLTSGFYNGHRVRGRTFIVPLNTAAYDTTGTLGSDPLLQLNAFATALIATGSLVVWSRPGGSPNPAGEAFPVVDKRVRDHVASLSSRRD